VLKTITKAVVMAALFCALPLVAQAAGLGKLTLISALGQPLNAEVEIVSLQAGEEDLSARLASPQAFAQAGIEPNAMLSDVRFTIERRGGTPILRLRSSQPINEPFIELLVELTWSSGRLVREYTFLLDPPEYKTRMATAATPPLQKPAAAEPTPAPTPPAQAEPQPQTAPPAEMKPEAPPPVSAAPSVPPTGEPPTAAPTPPPPPAAEPQTSAAPPSAAPSSSPPGERVAMPREPVIHEVKRGDTLGKIARANLPPGVTLNQMLLALYRANEDAFIRKNVNLVRAGRILNIPDADAAGTIDRAEADQVVKEHMAQFAEYRSRLAAAPTTAEAAPGRQADTGRIETKPAAPAPSSGQDQLRLSKAEPAKPGAGSQAAREDDAVARQRAFQEAQSRQADLERNVTDLRKLLDMKNQQLAELEKKATAKPAPTPAPTPAPAAKPAPPPEAAKPVPAAPVAPAKPPVEAPKPAAPEAAKPAAPPPPAEAAKPPAKPAPGPEAKKAETAKPDAKKGAPQPEASVVDEFLDNPLYLGLLGGLVVLLFAYGYIAWRRKKAAHAKFQDSVLGAAAAGAAPGTTAPLGTPTAGGGTAPAHAPAAAAAPAARESEEVDPIAEADVYMAYGRDAQAEEILKEALAKDSKRIPVQAKLLEIYAHRKDAKTFEQTALKLKQLTDGKGAEWDKAAALGRSIDPQNSIYGGGGDAPAAAAPVAAAAPAAAAPTLDFDLGGAGAGAQGPASAPDISLDEPAKEASAPALDFDLGGAPAAAKTDDDGDKTQVLKREEASGNIDFNLDLGGDAPAAAAPAAEAPKSAPAAEPSGGLDFDINLDLGGGGDRKAEPAAEKSAPAMDLSAISLDLGSAPAAAPSGGGSDPKWQEVATKLDLAKAYEEMGDKDGARELLNEVMKDGDAAQKGTAQQLLAKLG
jgi:pilus assembly protein FimV